MLHNLRFLEELIVIAKFRLDMLIPQIMTRLYPFSSDMEVSTAHVNI